MESVFFLIKGILVFNYFCMYIPLVLSNESSIQRLLHYNNISNASNDEMLNEYFFHETVDLFKCPGSTIANGLLNISEGFFSKYGSPDQFNPNYTLMVRFTQGEPECSSDSVFTSVEEPTENTGNGSLHQGHAFLIDGWILKYYNATYWESIPPNRYCVKRLDDGDGFTIKYCRSGCEAQPCISKCCFANEVCDLRESHGSCNCIDSGRQRWTSTVEQALESSYSFVHHIPESCDSIHFTLHRNSTNLNLSYENDFKILQNGTVIFYRNFDGAWITLPRGSYCVDGAAESDATNGQAHFSGDMSDMVLEICRSVDDAYPEEQQHFVLYTILVPFAAVFVLLTIVVYILTWHEQNTQGYTNFLYLITLLALYLFIVLGNMRTVASPNKRPTLCAFLAGAIHFSYLSSACWVTCLSYDVWRAFQTMNSMTIQPKKRRRLTMFCLFSIGYPLVQISVCYVLDAVYRDTPDEEMSFILPNYGRYVCNMSNDGITYYLYTPITILLVCNIGFFIATITAMIRYKKSIREAFSEVSNSGNPSKANQSFGIYTRLFIIMGIFWISQIISWFVTLNESSVEESLVILFAITDALTVLQAVAIFYIFVCKRSVFTKLWTLQPWLRPFLILWVKIGCCPLPTPTMTNEHRCNASNFGLARPGISKDTTEKPENNASNSRHSISNPSVSSPQFGSENDELTRQTSCNSDGSNVTVVSDVDERSKRLGKGEFENEPQEKISETKV